MDLVELINRTYPPAAWEEGDNIPWNEPGFSRRMLREHLSQAHDAASRRFEIIDRQVDWIHQELLSSRSSRVLDLACGPGFYSSRLARLGHTCFGIDFSPASIEFASAVSETEHLQCRYTLQDIRLAEYPRDVDLVMLIYGEFNVFRPEDIMKILGNACQALKPGGRILLEPHSFQYVDQLGKQGSTWYSSSGGLFSDQPHLVLKENFWDERLKTATIRYFVLDALASQVTRYAQSLQAYSETEYRQLLTGSGFGDVEIFPGISPADPHEGLVAITARKSL